MLCSEDAAFLWLTQPEVCGRITNNYKDQIKVPKVVDSYCIIWHPPVPVIHKNKKVNMTSPRSKVYALSPNHRPRMGQSPHL